MVAMLGFGTAAIVFEAAPLIDGVRRSRSVMIHGWPAIVTGLAFFAMASVAFFWACLPERMNNSFVRRRGITYSLWLFVFLVALAVAGVFISAPR
ncbi:MAG TPA: hypothetical protein VF110_15360 [Burkholderiales bacterium]